MRRANKLGLCVAIALSVGSASALSGEQHLKAMAFLDVFSVNSMPFATTERNQLATLKNYATARETAIVNPMTSVHAKVDPEMSLDVLRQAFITRVVADLSSENQKEKLGFAIEGDIK